MSIRNSARASAFFSGCPFSSVTFPVTAAPRVSRTVTGSPVFLRGVTSIVVSHDLTSIFSTADRIALIYQGVVHVVGTPDEIRGSPDPTIRC